MFHSLINERHWKTSPYSDLPVLEWKRRSVRHYLLVLAGGLALVLSRATPEDIYSKLAHASKLQRLLRIQLKRAGTADVTREMVATALMEVKDLADPMTIEAMRKLCRKFDDRDSSVNGRHPGAPTATPHTQAANTEKDYARQVQNTSESLQSKLKMARTHRAPP